jgi:uncharacterized membrane protein YjfL (UPF0719 family)
MFGEHFLAGLTGSVTFGILGVVMLLVGFKIFDWMLPKVDFQEAMKENSVATAIIVGSFFVSLALIISAVIQ